MSATRCCSALPARQDLHHGQSDRGDAAPCPRARPEQDACRQLYGEFKSFFPENAVEYFVSYYDYYQPEAYIRAPTPISRRTVDQRADRPHAPRRPALIERDDVIIVASVSCIYGIGSVETSAMTFSLKRGDKIEQRS